MVAMETNDMDIDMDIDLGPIDVEELEQDPADPSLQSNGANVTSPTQMEITDPESTTPHKIHIRGVDDLTTDDIKAFSIEHFASDPPTRIEWIDDTSANIVYSTPGVGLNALDELSLQSSPTTQLTELRTAKAFSARPDLTLHLRTALTSDQKKPRAHEASRFYMMHPEHDPRERRGRDKSHNSNGDYRRRRYGDDENRRRRRRDKEAGFDASMYDDNAAPSSNGRSLASSPDGRSQRELSRKGPNEIRNRSASPERRNGRGSRNRGRTPPPRYHKRDPNPFPIENEGKELFPTKSSKNTDCVGKDLFSNKLLAAGLKKELFPQKANTVSHRRSDAFDAADETADLFASGMTVPFSNGTKRGATNSLASRISAPSESTYGRLKSIDAGSVVDMSDGDDDLELNIRGASQNDQGFSIRGSAAGTIKELFPGKAAGNTGKELFAGKLEGRGARRTRAEDMFS